MATTNFKVFNEEMSSDRTFSDSEYNIATQRQGGVIPGMALSRLHNKLYRQSTAMAKAIADFLVAQGYDCNDNDVPGITTALQAVVLAIAESAVDTHSTAAVLDHPNGSVTDAKIGNRTITDTITAAAAANTVTNLLGMIGYMLKNVTGKSNWYTLPATTLQAISDLIVTTATANKLLKLNASGQLPADITGNAATATTATTAANATSHISAASGAHAASAISSTATGNIAATNVQAAIAELEAEKQPLDATLTALAALTTAANQMIYSTGADTFAMTALTAFARTLLDDGDAATARATLGAAPLVSPALTGTPTAPTAAAGTNTTQLATTAFVKTAIDYIGGSILPSNRFINLTLPASGGSYTAPANGWLCISKIATAAAQTLTLSSSTGLGYSIDNYLTGASLALSLPLKKDDIATINYSAAGTTNYYKFVYAEGAY